MGAVRGGYRKRQRAATTFSVCLGLKLYNFGLLSVCFVRVKSSPEGQQCYDMKDKMQDRFVSS